jgi:hypothetical protein
MNDRTPSGPPWNQDCCPSYGGQEQAVEVLGLHVEDEGWGTGNTGHSEKDRRRHLEGRVVKAGDAGSHFVQGGDVHNEEEQCDENRRYNHHDVAGHSTECPAGDGGKIVEESGRASPNRLIRRLKVDDVGDRGHG